MVREDNDAVVVTRVLAGTACSAIGSAAALTKPAAHVANTWHVVVAGARSHGTSLGCWSGANVDPCSRSPTSGLRPCRILIPMSRIAEALMVVPVRSPPNTSPTHISPFAASRSWKESAIASKVATRR